MKPKLKKLKRKPQYIATSATSWASESLRTAINSANKDGFKEILLSRAVSYTLIEVCRSYISLSDKTLNQLKKGPKPNV